MRHEYLIALEYHYPRITNFGIVALPKTMKRLQTFVRADSVEQAIEWGSVVATRLLNYVNDTSELTLQQFQHCCCVEDNPSQSGWSHCLEFFQHVDYGEMPDLDRMTTDAYVKWLDGNCKRNTMSTGCTA